MSSTTCVHCSAAVAHGTKFCRQCGHPTLASHPPSVTEATTQIFEPSAERRTPPHFTAAPSNPTYPAPAEHSAPATTALAAPGQKRSVVLISLVAATLIALGALAHMTTQRGRVRPPTPPAIVVPALPALPAPPEVPPMSGRDVPALSSVLHYPGAEMIMEMRRGEDGSALQLHSRDGLEKVVAWYVAQLRPTKNIQVPGASAILHADKATVVLTAAGSETNILIKQETSAPSRTNQRQRRQRQR